MKDSKNIMRKCPVFYYCNVAFSLVYQNAMSCRIKVGEKNLSHFSKNLISAMFFETLCSTYFIKIEFLLKTKRNIQQCSQAYKSLIIVY